MTWNSLLVLVLIVLSGFADSLGVTSAEIQTAVWFAMMIIGVVIFSRSRLAARPHRRMIGPNL